jgi:hypothetical protein
MTITTLSRIEQLRKLALALEPNEQQRVHWRKKVMMYTDEYDNSK